MWKPEFGAQPLPDFVMDPSLPLKSVQQPTKVEPFNLKTEEQGHQHSTKWLQNRCVSLANLHVYALGGTCIQ